MNLPSISCLCVTNGRKTELERAIRCFKAQSYPNKDLLIVCLDNDPIAGGVIGNINDPSISYLKVPSNLKLSLGELRNLSVQSCTGDFFCQWDDDDWYHNKRLEIQMNSILCSFKPACLLTHVFMFDTSENQAYLSHLNVWEGSILCDKSIFKDDIMYDQTPKAEDTYLKKNLESKNLIFPLIMPHLYTYVVHGKNTWDRDHFEPIFKYSQKFSEKSSLLLKHILDHEIDEHEGSDILGSDIILGPLKYY
jgi:glycosyltransferase involved in cell wall biosynthesis